MVGSRWRVVSLLFLAALSGIAIGCFGGTANPSYFPFYLPTGDIIRTHAKPPGAGYFADFDKHACLLQVQPLVAGVRRGIEDRVRRVLHHVVDRPFVDIRRADELQRLTREQGELASLIERLASQFFGGPDGEHKLMTPPPRSTK